MSVLPISASPVMDSVAGATGEEGGGDGTVVHIEPVPGGWRLRCEPCGEPLMFLSGRRAEMEGRALGRRLAALGLETTVAVHDGSSDVVAEFHFDPAEP